MFASMILMLVLIQSHFSNYALHYSFKKCLLSKLQQTFSNHSLIALLESTVSCFSEINTADAPKSKSLGLLLFEDDM